MLVMVKKMIMVHGLGNVRLKYFIRMTVVDLQVQVVPAARAIRNRAGHRVVAEGSLAGAAEEDSRPAGGTVRSPVAAGTPAEEGIAGAAEAGSRQHEDRILVWHHDPHRASHHGSRHAILSKG